MAERCSSRRCWRGRHRYRLYHGQQRPSGVWRAGIALQAISGGIDSKAYRANERAPSGPRWCFTEMKAGPFRAQLKRGSIRRAPLTTNDSSPSRRAISTFDSEQTRDRLFHLQHFFLRPVGHDASLAHQHHALNLRHYVGQFVGHQNNRRCLSSRACAWLWRTCAARRGRVSCRVRRTATRADYAPAPARSARAAPRPKTSRKQADRPDAKSLSSLQRGRPRNCLVSGINRVIRENR